MVVSATREDQEYGGVRVVLLAHVASARVRLQVDVGFGDAIRPPAAVIDFPVLLDFPAPRLRGYPRETVVAEKLEAMVQLGISNSRMKDFFDVALLARVFDFDGELLSRAIRATFERRGTPAPLTTPIALSAAFQWSRVNEASGPVFHARPTWATRELSPKPCTRCGGLSWSRCSR